MGRKPKAGGAEGKAEAAEGRMTDPAQSARFLEAAREAGVDETGEAFERAFRRVVVAEPSTGRRPRPGTPGRGKPKPTT